MKFEPEYIEKLAKLLSDSQLTEIKLQDGNQLVVLKKEKELVAQASLMAAAQPAVSQPHVLPQGTLDSATSPAPACVPQGTPITSPIVGTFYRAPSPTSEPFVKVGDTIAAGQVVCIIEAMKLMNEIEADCSGKVVQICVEDGEAVEYGQVLMYVE